MIKVGGKIPSVSLSYFWALVYEALSLNLQGENTGYSSFQRKYHLALFIYTSVPEATNICRDNFGTPGTRCIHIFIFHSSCCKPISEGEESFRVRVFLFIVSQEVNKTYASGEFLSTQTYDFGIFSVTGKFFVNLIATSSHLIGEGGGGFEPRHVH